MIINFLINKFKLFNLLFLFSLIFLSFILLLSNSINFKSLFYIYKFFNYKDNNINNFSNINNLKKSPKSKLKIIISAIISLSSFISSYNINEDMKVLIFKIMNFLRLSIAILFK